MRQDKFKLDPDLLTILFSLLQAPPPLNATLAGYFARVLASLLSKQPAPLHAFMQDRADLMEAMVLHLGTTSIAETLVRLIGADETPSGGLASSQQLLWLERTDIMSNLLLRLAEDTEGEQEANTRENAAEVLAAVARSRGSPLTAQLAAPDFLEQLLQHAFGAQQGSTLVQAFSVYRALLERRRHLEAAMRGTSGSAEVIPATDLDFQLEDGAIACLCPHVPALCSLLQEPGNPAIQETPYGVLKHPLGSGRLSIIGLLSELLRTADPKAEQAILHSGLLRVLLKLVLDYPFNAILHHQVASLMDCIATSSSEPLVSHMFEECQLLQWMTGAKIEIMPDPHPYDTRAKLRQPLRAGYIGQIINLANRLLALSIERELISSFLNGNDAWETWVRDVLEPTNKLQSPTAWQCGVPNRGGNNRSSSSDGDEIITEAEMNMGDGFGDSPFQQAAHRYPSFDDDDDDAEEDEDSDAIEAMWDPTKPQSLHVGTALAAAGMGASDMEAAQHEARAEASTLSTSPPDSWETLDAGDGLYEAAVALPAGPPRAPGEDGTVRCEGLREPHRVSGPEEASDGLTDVARIAQEVAVQLESWEWDPASRESEAVVMQGGPASPVAIAEASHRAPTLESASHGAMRSSLDDDISVMTDDGEVGGPPRSPKRRSGSRSPISPFQGNSPSSRSPNSPASPNGLSPHSSDSDDDEDSLGAAVLETSLGSLSKRQPSGKEGGLTSRRSKPPHKRSAAGYEAPVFVEDHIPAAPPSGAGDHIRSSSPPPAASEEQQTSSEEDASIAAQAGAESSKGAWLRGMVAGVTGMSERTKEALVPSIKNGRALLKSLGGMQISGIVPNEAPARESSPTPEPQPQHMGSSNARAQSDEQPKAPPSNFNSFQYWRTPLPVEVVNELA
ncbi:hypothetical protein WJX84_000145 [Apatococcus fuscideae]|uniref:SAPS-domain-containing protein n=1 Tax=Apatococcus fuscideae TaxID=2026836 RepID=A0AAW1T7D9_9CHLO